MRNFQDIFEIRKRSFISAFSICMNVPLKQCQFDYQAWFVATAPLPPPLPHNFCRVKFFSTLYVHYYVLMLSSIDHAIMQ